jgi:hypothetical protein
MRLHAAWQAKVPRDPGQMCLPAAIPEKDQDAGVPEAVKQGEVVAVPIIVPIQGNCVIDRVAAVDKVLEGGREWRAGLECLVQKISEC